MYHYSPDYVPASVGALLNVLYNAVSLPGPVLVRHSLSEGSDYA